MNTKCTMIKARRHLAGSKKEEFPRRLGLGESDYPHPPAETPIVHPVVHPPGVRFRSVDLDRFQVAGAVEAANRHQLPVHYSDADLNKNKA